MRRGRLAIRLRCRGRDSREEGIGARSRGVAREGVGGGSEREGGRAVEEWIVAVACEVQSCSA